MIEKIWRIAIVTSGLGGVSAFVFWSLYKEWLSLSVFSKLDPDHTFYILFAFLFLTFFSMIIILSTFIKVRTFEHKRQDIEDALHKVTGGITLPSEKQKVNKKIECSGFLLNLQPNIHAWIVIEVDNEFWPKLEPKPNKKGEWEETVLEYGDSKKVSLALYVCTSKANEEINRWLKKGQETDSYPGLRMKRGIRIVERVRDLIIVK